MKKSEALIKQEIKADKLSSEWVESSHYDEFGHKGSFKAGYLRAVKETNAVELLEALKTALDAITLGDIVSANDERYKQIENTIKKATE